MLYWWPKIKNLPIPQPRTEIYIIPKDVLSKLKEENMENLDMEEVKEVARKIGYPLFLRTDMASGKHFWDRSCFVEKEEDLKSHIFEVICFNLCADVFGGLDFHALIFREYIPMDNLFTAFYGKMPVNPEIRFFIRDRETLCWHWYWCYDAIEEPSISNWKEVMDKTKKEMRLEEWDFLFKKTKMVAKVMEGYWSIDFCRGKNGVWYLIDLAEAEKSWHEEGCKYKQTNVKEGN